MKKQHKIISLFVLIIMIAIGSYLYINDQLQPVGTNQEVIFTVEQNDDYKTVLKKLEEKHIIKNSKMAYLYVRLFNKKSLISGKFTLNSNQDVKTIVSMISDKTKLTASKNELVLIAGKWAKDYAESLEKITGIAKQDFLAKWNDKDYIKTLQNDYWFIQDDIFNEDKKILLEGYFAPDTYYLDDNMSVDMITRFILNQTKVNLDQYKEQISAKNIKISDLLTKASIVQFESSKKEDMKMIAQVLENRLNIKQKLEVSVSVCYALYEEFSDWQDCEKKSDYESPYNTYLHDGLPPGPIDNPSVDAIEAVLNPTPNDFYFFVGDVCGDNAVHYAKTYEEHLVNVAKYVTNGCLK